ncbi:MAG TPA: alcohol dehydrogenase catalytic domain-containing protein, partial [Limnochordales bacterium]
FAPEDVLVRVELCGICGSDIHEWASPDRARLAGPARPTVGGHEIVSVVEAVGPAVRGLKPGDRVVHEIVTFYCGQCVNCRQGKTNICLNMDPMAQRAHYVTGGGFAPYTVWPARHLHRLPDHLTAEEGVLMEPTAGSVHTLVERLRVRPGESVAILGTGARGLILLQVARALGAGPVVVTGLTRDEKVRLPLARELGADAVVNVEREDLRERLAALTGSPYVDVVVENAGSPAAVRQAIDIARPGGRVMISGGGIRGGIEVALDTRAIIVKELDVLGEISHTWSSWRTALHLVATGRVRLKPLLTHVFPLERWEQAFTLASTGDEAVRVAVRP